MQVVRQIQQQIAAEFFISAGHVDAGHSALILCVCPDAHMLVGPRLHFKTFAAVAGRIDARDICLLLSIYPGRPGRSPSRCLSGIRHWTDADTNHHGICTKTLSALHAGRQPAIRFPLNPLQHLSVGLPDTLAVQIRLNPPGQSPEKPPPERSICAVHQRARQWPFS